MSAKQCARRIGVGLALLAGATWLALALLDAATDEFEWREEWTWDDWE